MRKEKEVSKNKNSVQDTIASEKKQTNKPGALDNRVVDEEESRKGVEPLRVEPLRPVPVRAPAAGYPAATYTTQGTEFSAVAHFTSVYLLSPPKQAMVLFNSSHYRAGPSLGLTKPSRRGQAYGARSVRCQASSIPSIYLWEPFFVDMVHHNYFMVTAGGGTSRAASKANYPFKPATA